VAERSGSSQSTRQNEVGVTHAGLRQVDPQTPSPAPLSPSPLLRHSSFIRAVCVDALVRICAGCALKLMKFSLLKWRPRQSLARSRVPSLAWPPVTVAAKRRPGGCRPECRKWKDSPEIDRGGSSRPYPVTGKAEAQYASWRVC
jgi:hypothetical protein